MNERIREVWIKAAREDSDPDNWDTQEQFIERFAELIVRECIDCAVWVGKSNHNPVEPIHTTHAVKRRIEKHFGVKE